jgi:hypothetical protein
LLPLRLALPLMPPQPQALLELLALLVAQLPEQD